MGHLDERRFGELMRGCPDCGSTAYEIATYLDRKVSIMYGDANDDGVWAHDGEKLIDGITRMTCLSCRRTAYASEDCPRCHAPNGLSLAATASRLAPPKKCRGCGGAEMTLLALAPAVVRTPAGGGKPPTPTPKALFGDDGFHVVAIACDDCDWSALAPGCALCDAPGPLRPRP